MRAQPGRAASLCLSSVGSDIAAKRPGWALYGLAIGMAVLIALGDAAAADLTGKPRIIDGDTIEIAGQRIRLHGIDARGSDQTRVAGTKRWPCGRNASSASRSARATSRFLDLQPSSRGLT